MGIDQLIRLARKHASNGAEMQSSAQVCLEDAVKLRKEGNAMFARKRALKSLQYSIGIFHPDYLAAAN